MSVYNELLQNRSGKLKHAFLSNSQPKEENRRTNKPLLAISEGILLVEKQRDWNASEATEV